MPENHSKFVAYAQADGRISQLANEVKDIRVEIQRQINGFSHRRPTELKYGKSTTVGAEYRKTLREFVERFPARLAFVDELGDGTIQKWREAVFSLHLVPIVAPDDPSPNLAAWELALVACEAFSDLLLQMQERVRTYLGEKLSDIPGTETEVTDVDSAANEIGTTASSNFGRNLDRLRHDRGLSYDDLANSSDVAKKLLIGYVKRGKGAYPSTKKKIANALGVRVEELEK